MASATMVASLLWLYRSLDITSTGRRFADLDPIASPRSAQKILPLVITTPHPSQQVTDDRHLRHRQLSHRFDLGYQSLG